MNHSVKSVVQTVEGMVARGQRPQALALLKDALRTYPRDGRLWYWLARCVENPAHATDALRRALQFDPALEEAQELFVWVQTGNDPTEWEPEPQASPPAAQSSASSSEWSFLSELGGDEGEWDEPPAAQPAVSDPSRSRPESFSFLAEIEGEMDAAPEGVPAAAFASAAPVTEASLWQRAFAFIGVPEDPALAPEPPPGTFSLSDAPPSPVQDIPVRNTLTPLSSDQVSVLLDGERKAKPAKPAKTKSARTPREPHPVMNRAWRRALTAIVVVLVLGGLIWAILRFDATPAAVRDLHPIVATQVAEGHLRTAPAPTAFPLNSWMEEARDDRYANRTPEAISLLERGVASEPDNVVAAFMLSDVLRDQPERSADALAVAQAAAERVNSLDERAYAAQALVWAIAVQPQPDMELARTAAGQAAAESGGSPHAQWARAMYAAMTDNAGEALTAASLAEHLDSGAHPAVSMARRAEILQRLGQTEEAIQLYETALADLNYIPWRVQVIELLGEIGRDAKNHLSELRALDPDHPLLNGQ